ncbi:MAG: phage holin family protein [Acidimicrobiia bacterium]|nr:phage holin family protein [Acidimicrobiia bacterium]
MARRKNTTDAKADEAKVKDAKRPASGIPGALSDLKDLAVSYAKQETIDPLRGLGRFVGLGVAGSLLLGVGVSLLGLAGLRALQTETGSTFTGNWSWAPYLIAFVLLLGLAAMAGSAITKESRKREDRT